MSSKKIGFWSVWALGVGGIVGGLFPALGVVIQIADVGAPVAFAIARTIALITFANREGTVSGSFALNFHYESFLKGDLRMAHKR
nr:hypothetical protein [Nostoc sp. ChiSLP03a]MDZ8213968.1 hypothetical protein [Nostoc sp. ChiSLP03a]